MTLPIWAEEQKYIYCFPANQLLFPGVQNYSLEGWDKKKNGRKIFCGLKNRERYSKHAYVSSPAPFLSKLNEDAEVGVRRGRLGQGNWGKLKRSFNSFYSEIPLKEDVSHPVPGVLFVGACLFFSALLSFTVISAWTGIQYRRMYIHIFTAGRLSCVNHYSFYGNQWSYADLHDKRIAPLYLAFKLKKQTTRGLIWTRFVFLF